MVKQVVKPYFVHGFGRTTLDLPRGAVVVTALRYLGHVAVVAAVDPVPLTEETEPVVLHVTTIDGPMNAPAGTSVQFLGIAVSEGPDSAPTAVVFVEVAE